MNTVYYTLGGDDNIQRGAASALTWSGGGRTAEVLLLSLPMIEFDPTYDLAFCYWYQKKVSETKLVPLIPAWPPSCGGNPLSAASCPLYALGVLAQAGLLNQQPSASSALGRGKFLFPTHAGKAPTTKVGWMNSIL